MELLRHHSALTCLILNLTNMEMDFAISTFSQVASESLGSPTLLSIFGSRMFFNLKEAAERNADIDSRWSVESQNAIVFGGRTESRLGVENRDAV